jgi:hypothetical protein
LVLKPILIIGSFGIHRLILKSEGLAEAGKELAIMILTLAIPKKPEGTGDEQQQKNQLQQLRACANWERVRA